MMLKTFPKGGIHPQENKISSEEKIKKLPLPDCVSVLVSQHIGLPASPLVKSNDEVKVGELIAKSSGFISANIHSPVSGKVLKIDDVMDASGYKRKAIIIKVEGDQWGEGIDTSETLNKHIQLSAEEIKNKVLACGIVGLGGATFPSHVKLSIPKGKKCEYVIINGVECEPYLTSDHRLMLEKGEEIIIGIKILLKALNVEKAIIGIENNKINAIDHLRNLSKDSNEIQVQPLKVQYPQGGEKQLVKALVNREIPPPPGLPIDVGCVILNVGTTFAIYEAVQKNKPLLQRVITVTGKSLAKKSNLLVRIGTPIKHLIDALGGEPENIGKIISGGPMMGKALSSRDTPVTKGTSGILILPNTETKRKKTENCIRCARCVEVCPLGLEPYLLSAISRKSFFEKAEKENIVNCIECGCCSYICPSSRPLLDYIRLGKSTVMKLKRTRG